MDVAPDLLGLVLESTVGGYPVRGRIMEVEAYREDDPASHTFRGRTARNLTMFGPAGHLYVYLSYGVHQCANIVTGPSGSGAAVLLRGVAPVSGIDTMRTRRRGRQDHELADGPGKLCQALAIGAHHDGIDVCSPSSEIRLLDDGFVICGAIRTGPRIGISRGTDRPWRFRLPSD